TGGVCIAPRPAEPGAEIRPAMAMRPFFGIQPALMDEMGQVLTGNDVSGALCIGQPWPGMARSIYGDHKRFVDAYFKPYPGYYFTGDGAHRTADGYYQITGRMDDVINVSGHRLGTAEIEDVLDEHPDVPETAVIGISHDVKGEVPFAFVVMKENISGNQEAVVKELRQLVATKIAKYAVPDHFLVVKRLPKTRSGKIMRRILRKVAMGQMDSLGDVSTLDDPSVVNEIIDAYQHYRNQAARASKMGQVLTGNDVSGALCIGQPWPGMARSIYGDHKRFVDAYFKPYPGYYFTGDGAHRTADGYYQITGRMDDVINVSGHRLGTAEIEDVLDEHPDVPETAVIGISHDVKGEVPFAFVVMKENISGNQEAVVKELRQLVATKIAKYAVPDHFLVVKRLPKTRSGKIMRRILRKVAMGQMDSLGDVSTLDDPSVVNEIIDAYQHYRNQAARASKMVGVGK
ncbi:acetyl-coenzyme A synthetase 2-like, mitochondrial, partial [Tachysurus ichikawai]